MTPLRWRLGRSATWGCVGRKKRDVEPWDDWTAMVWKSRDGWSWMLRDHHAFGPCQTEQVAREAAERARQRTNNSA